MTKWTPTSKERLQDTLYYGFFWVQKYGSKKPYPVWRTNLPSHSGHVLTHNFEDGSSIRMEEIEAWFRPDHISLPEPYIAPKPPKDLVGTWIDGAKEVPGAFEWHYLIQVKAEKSQRYARYFFMDKVFKDILKHGIFQEEQVWWLKLEDKKEDDDDE